MTTPATRIVFLGTHGQYNVGDELLLETFLTQLGAEHDYVVNSYDPGFTSARLVGRFRARVIDTARDRVRLLRALRTCDLVVFGGGSIIKELYASTGRHRHATLLMILAIVSFTRVLARKRVAMLNVGVGPVRTTTGLWLTRLILSQVDRLTVRDARSLDTCRTVGVDAVLSTDAVFSVDRAELLGDADGTDDAPQHAVSPAPEEPGSPLRVALNLNFDIEEPTMWEPFLEALAHALTSLHRQRALEIHGLPMQTGFKEQDDAEVLREFATRIPEVPFVAHAVTDHVSAARVIAGCDLLVAERLHAIIIASILGVPAFVLAYDVKVRELSSMLGLEPWSVDINAAFDADDLADRILDLSERRAEVSTAVGARTADLARRARADFQAVRTWIASLG